MKTGIFSLLILLFLGCSAAPIAQAPPAPMYYRFFRGTKLPTLPQKEYLEKLSTTFIPALPKMYTSDSLLAYLPAVPPAYVGQPPLAEIALIVYRSEEIYKKVRSTPEGLAYGDLHWTVFDKATSKSGAPVPFTGKVEVDTPYDVIGKNIDWNDHYTTIFVGTKKQKHTTAEFHSRLAHYVSEMKRNFGGMIQGYLFVAGPDYQIAYMNWHSEGAMKAAFETSEGSQLAADSTKWMAHRMFETLSPFTGKAEPAHVYQMEIRK